MCLSQALEYVWLEAAARKIRAKKFKAYFVPMAHGIMSLCKEYFVILRDVQCFREQYWAEWQKFISGDDAFKIYIYEDKEAEDCVVWDAKIAENPGLHPAMAEHPINSSDVVLMVRRIVTLGEDEKEEDIDLAGPLFEPRRFADRQTAECAFKLSGQQWNCVSFGFNSRHDDYRRKVMATNSFLPSSEPTNPGVWGLKNGGDEGTASTLPATLKHRMALHRCMLRGQGFYELLVSKCPFAELADKMKGLLLNRQSTNDVVRTSQVGQLPVSNFLDLEKDIVQALLEEIPPVDLLRFREYFSERPLGFGMITAGPGCDITTTVAVNTLFMAASKGMILCSAPTQAAVDSFAGVLFDVAARVVRRLNQDTVGDEGRAHRALIVRGYKPDREFHAFMNFLRDPTSGDQAAPAGNWYEMRKWKLFLSATYWLLVILRSPFAPPLNKDDHVALHMARKSIDNDTTFSRLRDLAMGRISWQQYEKGPMITEVVVMPYFEFVWCNASILCTTPAISDMEPFCSYKRDFIQGIAVVDAGKMSRPDLYCIWGNTLLPCVLSGDEEQVPSLNISEQGKDDMGNPVNRFANDGAVSALAFFRAAGWPVYHVETKLDNM